MVGATISIDAYKKAEAALRDSDRRKDEFLAMLAHELRNPLAPISAAAQLLQAAAATSCRSCASASDVIARQVTHMTKLVDDLLDVSRVTRGLIELRPRRGRPRCRRARPCDRAGAPGDRGAGATASSCAAAPSPARVHGDAHAAGAGDRQPAQQRGQVHAAGRRRSR